MLAERYGVSLRAAQALREGALQGLQLHSPADLICLLKLHQATLEHGLAQAEATEAASAWRRSTLRWVAIAVILAVSAYFWWRRASAQRAPPTR